MKQWLSNGCGSLSFAGSAAYCCGCGGAEIESSGEARGKTQTCAYDPPSERGVVNYNSPIRAGI